MVSKPQRAVRVAIARVPFLTSASQQIVGRLEGWSSRPKQIDVVPCPHFHAAFVTLYGRTKSSAGIFQACAMLWIIATVRARRRDSSSDAREREPRIVASSA